MDGLIKERRKLSWEELQFSLLMTNRTSFIVAFWGDDMVIPKERKDLPKEYRKYKHVISTEVLYLWQDYSQFSLVSTSRKIGKTLYLEAFNVQECITYTGDALIEAMFFAPGEHQINPVLNRLQSKVRREPIFDLMLENWNNGDGIVNWKNNVVLHLRIEGRQGGQNMIGLRARLYMIGDEMAYGSQAAYDERQNTATPECRIVYCGVPNGVRGTPFYRLDQTALGSQYRRHKYWITANPLYHSRKAIRSELRKHGDDVNSQSWITQVLGQWGAEAQSSFPVVPVNSGVRFRTYSLTVDDLKSPESIADIVRLPSVKCNRYIIAGDIGYSPSPTELGIFAEVDVNVWQQLTRISLLRVDMPEQAAIIDALNRHVLPVPAAVIGIDAHGQGSGVLQSLHSELMGERYGWYNYRTFAFDVGFAGTTEQKGIYIHKSCGSRVRQIEEYWYCDECRVPVWTDEELKFPKIQTKQVLTTYLKSALEAGKSWLDKEEAGVAP